MIQLGEYPVRKVIVLHEHLKFTVYGGWDLRTVIPDYHKLLTCKNIYVWEDSVEKTNSWKSLSTVWIRLNINQCLQEISVLQELFKYIADVAWV